MGKYLIEFLNIQITYWNSEKEIETVGFLRNFVIDRFSKLNSTVLELDSDRDVVNDSECHK